MAFEEMQIMAGVISTPMFVSSNLPMLWKAFATKDLTSYSFGHIGLSNLGNLIYWLYLLVLPVGPVWFLHGFNTLVAGLMLFGYLRYQRRRSGPKPIEERGELGLNPQIEPGNPVFCRVCPQ
ncbi:MAG TPA: hypothetical protein VEC93_04370 [Anaerolineae bacterium]|nr:hypothetical protein [Anaerolineae bacterium]